MDSKTFLEIMSLQRHDFLNHLQVISGLVQLNKADRVKEYIKQVSTEMEKMSRISCLRVPEAALALLLGNCLAEKYQVKVVYDISTNIDHCSVPGEILGEVIGEAFGQSLECHVSSGLTDNLMKISIARSENKYQLRILFPEPPCGVADTARCRLAVSGRKLVAHGGEVGVVVSGSCGEVFITLPCKLPEQDSFGT
ncbi:MAG: Spo0B domain-containing protein [Firmicutes bacterium]|nr:Spo0B domain-containing protein [Bacillota bacterium]